MTDQSTASTWWPLWWLQPPATALADINEPILPGWSFSNFTINEQNSSAPDTERSIVAAESYGRQLGRVLDALAVLIEDLPEPQQQRPEMRELLTLHEKIGKIKLQSATRRVDRFLADLDELKATDMDQYRRVTARLRDALS